MGYMYSLMGEYDRVWSNLVGWGLIRWLKSGLMGGLSFVL